MIELKEKVQAEGSAPTCEGNATPSPLARRRRRPRAQRSAFARCESHGPERSHNVSAATQYFIDCGGGQGQEHGATRPQPLHGPARSQDGRANRYHLAFSLSSSLAALTVAAWRPEHMYVCVYVTRLLIRCYLPDSKCPACGADFVQRLRLIVHVSDSRRPKCRDWIFLHCPRLPHSRVAKLDEVDREQRRSAQRAGHSHHLAVAPARSTDRKVVGRVRT